MGKRTPDYEYVEGLRGIYVCDRKYQAMIRNMAPGCDVEASSTKQGGTITKIIRNVYGVPVCVKVASGEHGEIVDYISVDRIDFFEPTRDCSGYYDEMRWPMSPSGSTNGGGRPESADSDLTAEGEATRDKGSNDNVV